MCGAVYVLNYLALLLGLPGIIPKAPRTKRSPGTPVRASARVLETVHHTLAGATVKQVLADFNPPVASYWAVR